MDTKIKYLLEKKSYDVCDLMDIVRILRSENGCPWDKVQTHKSIKKDFLEEVYEVMEAIDCDSPEMMQEELGDVLLQVVFHTVLEDEEKHFTLDDVTNDVCRKLIVRHPHVFGDVNVDGVDDVLRNWDSIKMDTKGQETYTDTLESVPKNFPALMRAQKLGKRAAKAGIDYSGESELSAWQEIDDCTNSIHEAIKCGDDEDKKTALGKMLFACANMARTMGFDAEEVLTAANDDFVKHFAAVEKTILCDGKSMNELDEKELEAYWNKAK